MSDIGTWQPIETAPKGEMDILICRQETNDMLVAYWDDDSASPDHRWNTLDGTYHKDWPTHWMPLPDPPKEMAG